MGATQGVGQVTELWRYPVKSMHAVRACPPVGRDAGRAARDSLHADECAHECRLAAATRAEEARDRTARDRAVQVVEDETVSADDP